MKNHYVYVVKAGRSAVKFGVAKDVDKRIASLQVGNHRPLYVHARLGPFSRAEAFHIEKHFHRHFSNLHMLGEWFNIKAAYKVQNALREYILGDQYVKGPRKAKNRRKQIRKMTEHVNLSEFYADEKTNTTNTPEESDGGPNEEGSSLGNLPDRVQELDLSTG